jgi:hypothetical protein
MPALQLGSRLGYASGCTSMALFDFGDTNSFNTLFSFISSLSNRVPFK